MRVVSGVAVDAEKLRARGELVVLSEDRAGVPETSEILRRKEAQRGRRALGADGAASVACPDRLRGVLQERDRIPGGDVQ